MFLRFNRRRKDGKEHRYWNIVENRRCAGGKVVQRQVLYLGEINDGQREAWCQLIEAFDEGSRRRRQLALFPADREVPACADGCGVQVRLDAMELHRPRQGGACWPGGQYAVRKTTARFPEVIDSDQYCIDRFGDEEGQIGVLDGGLEKAPDFDRTEYHELKRKFEGLYEAEAERLAAEENEMWTEFGGREFLPGGLRFPGGPAGIVAGDEVIRLVRASDLAGKEVPEREWIVPDFIPNRTVTGLSGDGGTGKSLLAMQLACGAAYTREWVGLSVETQGPVIYFSAEDELDEMHRRLVDICNAEGINLADLEDLNILPLAGLDPILSTFDRRNGSMLKTPLWTELVEVTRHLRLS
jgi:hypothetical protein